MPVPLMMARFVPEVSSAFAFSGLESAPAKSNATFPSREGRKGFVLLIDNSQSLQRVNAREPCVYFWRRRVEVIS